MPKIYNKRTDRNIPPDAVYVGRPSKWGNKYVIGRDGDRAEVCRKHRDDVLRDREIIKAIKRELRGKDLVCWCVPEECHATTYLEIANER